MPSLLITPTPALLSLSDDDRERLSICVHRGYTSARTRTRFAEGGVEAVLTDKRQERRRQALSGPQQAHLIALACSDAPAGHDHWTLRLLAGKAVELGYVEHISPETIRALLRRTSSSRGSIVSGVSPQ